MHIIACGIYMTFMLFHLYCYTEHQYYSNTQVFFDAGFQVLRQESRVHGEG